MSCFKSYSYHSMKGDLIYFVFNLRVEGQDILSFVGSKPRPNEEDIAFVIRPLIEVVNYLHGQKIVHLDIRVSRISGSSCSSIIIYHRPTDSLTHFLTH